MENLRADFAVETDPAFWTTREKLGSERLRILKKIMISKIAVSVNSGFVDVFLKQDT